MADTQYHTLYSEGSDFGYSLQGCSLITTDNGEHTSVVYLDCDPNRRKLNQLKFKYRRREPIALD